MKTLQIPPCTCKINAVQLLISCSAQGPRASPRIWGSSRGAAEDKNQQPVINTATSSGGSPTSANAFSSDKPQQQVSSVGRDPARTSAVNAHAILGITGIFRKPRCHHGNRFRLPIVMHRHMCSKPAHSGRQPRCKLLAGGHAAGLRAVSINSLAFLNIFAGCLNESPGMEMEEKKGVPILSFFLGGAIQFRERIHRDPP